MTDPLDPQNALQQQFGNYEALISKASQLIKGDSTKNLDDLSKMLDALRRYEKMTGKEAGEANKLSELTKKLEEMLKEAQIKQDDKIIQQEMDGGGDSLSNIKLQKIEAALGNNKQMASAAFQNSDQEGVLGNLKDGSGTNHSSDIESLAFLTLMQSAKDSQDDLKNIMGIVKSLNDSKAGIRRNLSGLVTALILVLGLSSGAGIWYLSRGDGKSQIANTGGAVFPKGSGGTTPSGSVCSVHLTNPTADTKIPDFGATLFEWTGVPNATSYSLEIDPPKGGGSPWLVSVNGTSKNIYMENFPAGGDYQVSVHALGANGEVLCSETLKFTKLAYDPSGNKEGDGSGSGSPCTTTGIMSNCP